MAFRYDTKHLSSQQRAIINQRDDAERRRKEELKRKQEQTKKPSQAYQSAIFMKLGQDATGKFTGMETLDIYERFISENRCVWFSTNSLSTGMSKTKINEYEKAIKSGEIVDIYFAVGKNVEGTNEIVYKASVLQIVSDAEGIFSPYNKLTPDVWRDLKNKIWIRVDDMKSINNIKASDFIVSSTGSNLEDVISKSQYHFGYIEFIK
jgi:hypothetical protein